MVITRVAALHPDERGVIKPSHAEPPTQRSGVSGLHDTPYGLGSCGKEVTSAIPVQSLVHAHQAQIGLVHQRSSLQRLAWLFLGQLVSCQAS